VLTTRPGGADTFANYTFPSNFTKLLSVEFVGGEGNPSNEFAIDNIKVNSVPELSTWAMMLLGFSGLGFAGYRQSKKGPRNACRLAR
jgi:hypothetical protein